VALAASLLGAITFNTTAGSKTVTATPTLGDMIVVIVAGTGVASGIGVSETTSPDGHGNYTQIVSSVKNASADQMAAFVRADPVRKSASTTWTSSGDGSSTGGGLYVMRITGATISGAAFIRQSGAQNNGAASGTPTIALGTGAALTTNALITVMWNTTNAAPTLTVPAGFAASDVNTNYNTPGTGIQGTHANSGITASTITWGSTSASAFSAIAFEMRADQGNLAVSPEIPQIVAEQSVKKAVFCLGDKWARKGRLWVPRPGILIPSLV
jgi:hypothetical protein